MWCEPAVSWPFHPVRPTAAPSISRVAQGRALINAWLFFALAVAEALGACLVSAGAEDGAAAFLGAALVLADGAIFTGFGSGSGVGGATVSAGGSGSGLGVGGATVSAGGSD